MKSILFLFAFPFLSASKTDIKKEIHRSDSFLVNKNWRLDEIRFLQDNIPYYYKRGDNASSNMNFDNDFIIFFDAGNGTYHQSDGEEYPLTWTQNDQEDLIFTIKKFRFKKDLVVTWEHLRYEGDTIHYTEFYTHANGVHSLADAIRSCNCSTPYVQSH